MPAYPVALAITNGNAESTTGWTASVGTLAIGNFGGVHQGSFKFFSTGAPTAAGSIHRHYQDLAISSTYNADIDAGLVTAEFTAWLSRGGPDFSRLEIEAMTGVAGTSLGLVTGAFQDASTAQFSWLEKSIDIVLPAGTRAIRIWLSMQNNDAGNTDGYIDGPMSLTLYGPMVYVAKLAANTIIGSSDTAIFASKVAVNALLGAHESRLTASKLMVTVLSGALPNRITASKLSVNVAFSLIRNLNGPVQIF